MQYQNSVTSNGLRSKLAIGLGALTCAAAIAKSAPKTVTYYVDQAAPANGQDGSSWQRAFRNLNDAIDAAWYDGLVNREFRIAKGTYVPGKGSLDQLNSFAFIFYGASATTLSIRGSFAGFAATNSDAQDFVSTPTVLSGDLKGNDQPEFVNREDNAWTVMRIRNNSQQTTVEGLVVRAGYCPKTAYSNYQASGGLSSTTYYDGNAEPYWGYGQFLLTDCTFEENFAEEVAGGGLSARSTIVRIQRSTFRNNWSKSGMGGGAFVSVPTDWPSDGLLTSCTFENNRAWSGGALSTQGWQGVSNCVFVGNNAQGQGGAIFGETSVYGSLLIRNTAGSSGGAIASTGLGKASVGFSTIAGNRAPTASAISYYTTSLDLANSIVWGNENEIPGTPVVRALDGLQSSRIAKVVLQGGLEQVEITGFTPGFTSPIRTTDPMFIRPASADASNSDWRAWNYRLRSGSSGAGIAEGTYATDLDGFSLGYPLTRPVDAGCYFAGVRWCPANLDRNSMRLVDDADFAIFVSAYELMVSPPANPDADFNRDGVVDDADFSVFAVAYDAMVCP